MPSPKQKPHIIGNPVPTVEETRVRLGMSKKHVERIKEIMASPSPRRRK